VSTPFNNHIPKAGFLFGSDIEEYLSVAATKWNRLRGIQGVIGGPHSKPEHLTEQQELVRWFDEEAQNGAKRKFEKYLNFERWH
jgi:hypothetical protein